MKRLKLWLALSPLAIIFTSASAFAADGNGGASYWGPVGAGLAIGLAALGGSLGQGKSASAGLEGMARNPQANLLVPMIIALALTESLVLFAFLVAQGILGKI